MRALCAKKTIFLILTLIMLLPINNAAKTSSNETLSNSGRLISDRTFEKSEVIKNVSQNNVDLKYILQWTSPLNVPFVYMGKGQDGFIERKCPYTNCIVTANRSYLDNDITKFDVIAFAGPELVFYDTSKLPEKRSPHQKYVFASIESSDYYPLCSKKFNKYFNWTWTFRLDSEVRWGYLTIRDKNKAIIGPNKEMHWIKLEDMDPASDNFKQQLKMKTKAAVWFVSNCNTRSRREAFASKLQEELQKFELNLDILGACGSLSCSRDGKDDCDKIIKLNYHFYLSFENSFNEDYVTEKLFRALNNDAVPIVYGGANYTRFMPDGIYLDADRLNSKKLARKMYELMNDPEKYAEYFKWKNHYSYHMNSESVETDPYCLFCTTLNDEEMIEDTSHRKGGGGGTFLVPMNGGIWTMCVSLGEEEVSILSRAGFPSQPVCTNYLANGEDEEPRADWQHRMQNLSISCALVCLIVLGSAALVGAFGICKHQISAVLITGVMYLLAGLFAMFTLMIIHFKRVQRVSARGSSHADGGGDGVLGPRGPALSLLAAREFSTAWSLDLGWGGVALATTTSLLWILLSKIMRYNPITAMLCY